MLAPTGSHLLTIAAQIRQTPMPIGRLGTHLGSKLQRVLPSSTEPLSASDVDVPDESVDPLGDYAALLPARSQQRRHEVTTYFDTRDHALEPSWNQPARPLHERPMGANR
jgi:hypothetical protein